MNNNILLANANDTMDIVDLLNKVTLTLYEKGINQWDYPWHISEIEKDVLNKYVYLLKLDDLVVGTFSIKDMKPTEFFDIGPNSKYLYRIAILPEYQGKGLGKQILEYCYEYIDKIDGNLYLDCWAGNGKLKTFYSNAGFTHIGDFPEDDYLVSFFEVNSKKVRLL